MGSSFELSGTPALLVMIVLLSLFAYLFLYLPVKLITTVIAHGKQKADRLRLLQQKTVIAEYDPPANLTPAEIGFLFDAKLSIAEVFATIVNLQQRSLATIGENEGKLMVYEVKIGQSSTAFEGYILGRLDNHKGKTINKRFLENIRRSGDQVMKQQLQEKGYLLPIKEQIKRSFLRLSFIMAMLIILFPVLAFRPNTLEEITNTVFFLIVFWPGYFIVSIFLYSTYQKIAGEPWLGTGKLKQIWTDIEGYRGFIQMVELDNLQFESETTKGIIKDKTLPYAIALGFNTGWLKKV